MRRSILAAVIVALSPGEGALHAEGEVRPNVLWIVAEDLNPIFGCYGETLIRTPRVDGLAAEGVRFERAFATASVCSASRSALITGTVQTSFGLHHHRSSRGGDEIFLPEGVKTVPELFRAAGYFTFNVGKEDYNFIHDLGALYSAPGGETDWSEREEGQPFFAQIQISGGKAGENPEKPVDRSKVPVPPYYPDINAFHEPLARQYDAAQLVDAEVGEILDRLGADGLAGTTAVFFFADQGRTLVRDTQFLYDPGIHVPLIVRWPGGGERAKAGTVRKDLVSGIDIAATSLAVAGIPLPDYFEGRDFFAEDFRREFVVAARDRCDFTIDRIRAVRTEKFKYIRNFFPERPYLQAQIRDASPQVVEWKHLGAEGELDAAQQAFLAATKPEEELYDLESDPHEVNNLAGEEGHGEILKKMRGMLEQWEKETGDKGREPESEAGLRAVIQRWGGRCVAPEFEAIRAGAGK